MTTSFSSCRMRIQEQSKMTMTMTCLLTYVSTFALALFAVGVIIVWVHHWKIPVHLSTPMLSIPVILPQWKSITSKWKEMKEEAQDQDDFAFKIRGQWQEGLELFPIAVGAVQALGESVRSASISRMSSSHCSGGSWKGIVRVILPLTCTPSSDFVIGRNQEEYAWRDGEPMAFDPTYSHNFRVPGDPSLFLVLDILRPDFPHWLERCHERIKI